MALSILTTALARARASWRGQLMVLLAGAILNVVVAGLPYAAGGVLALILVAGAAHVADLELDEFGPEAVGAGVVGIVRFVPRLLIQVGLALAPLVVVASASLLAAGAMPLLGLMLVPLVFVLAALTAPVVMLAIVAVVRGDRHWIPVAALTVLRARPATLALAVFVGSVVIGLASIPVVLGGFVLTALLGPLGAVGLGVAAAAAMPFAGCWALALWDHASADVQLQAPASSEADPLPALEALLSPWVDGPSWDATLAPHAAWGTWVRLEGAADVAIRIVCGGATAPELSIGFEDGSWRHAGPVAHSGAAIEVSLPAGNAYLQVTSADAQPQVVQVTMLVRSAAAA